VPVEFVACVEPGHALDEEHHRQLLINCFAQGAALMSGKGSDDPHRNYPGDRPSATILLDRLDPATLGALIAFYEHRTFVNAVLLGLNPFDQFGVELGKSMAKAIDSGDEIEFDPSTQALIDRRWGMESTNERVCCSPWRKRSFPSSDPAHICNGSVDSPFSRPTKDIDGKIQSCAPHAHRDMTRRTEESETLPYPKGMAEAARKAKERLASSGKLEIERDAQREINDRVQEFGKAA
jgi:hypothetical protein